MKNNVSFKKLSDDLDLNNITIKKSSFCIDVIVKVNF